MKKRLKLNMHGFAHHAVIALLIVGSITAFGAYRVLGSKADSFSSSKRAASNVNSASQLSANTVKANSASNDKTAADCANLHRHFNSSTKQCTDCYDAWQDQPGQDHGACVPRPTSGSSSSSGGGSSGGGSSSSSSGGGSSSSGGGKTQDDCNNLHRHYDGSTQNCTDCWDAWQDQPGQDHGACVPRPTGGSGSSSGGGGSGGSTSSGGGSSSSSGGGKTQADCNNLHRHYNGSTQQCTDCWDAWQDQPGQDHGACVPKSVSGSGSSSSGGSNSSSSSGSSSSGSSSSSSSSSSSNGGGSGGSKTVAECNDLHRHFNAGSKSCTDCWDAWQDQPGQDHGACVQKSSTTTTSSCNGLVAIDGSCVPNSKIDDYCKDFHLNYDKSKNKCDGCIDNYHLSDGICVKKGTDPTVNPPVLALDASISHDTCTALGRQWESGATDAAGSKVKGCASNKCDISGISIVNNDNGAVYCKGYISKISQTSCSQLHRNWVASANGCMQNHQAKDDGARVGSAPECIKDYSTYVFKSGEDECISPSVAESLQSIAQTTGKPVSVLVDYGKAQLCNIQPHKHWNGDKCVEDTPATGGTSTNNGGGNGSGSSSSSSSSSSSGSGSSKAPNGQSWASFCGSLGRPVSGNNCSHTCNDDLHYMFNGSTSYTYDKCVPRSTVCNTSGGTKQCTTTTACSVQAPDCTNSTSTLGTQGNPVIATCAFMNGVNTAYSCQHTDPRSHAQICNSGQTYGPKVVYVSKFSKWYKSTVCS